MTGLLADGWFYISSAGLLVSAVLFFFLLGQYRAAADAADASEPEAAAEAHAPIVRPLSIPEPAPFQKLATIPADKPSEMAPAPERPEASTSGVNPATVYLQNIKSQLEEIRGETRDMVRRMDAISARDEALIERLSELAQAVAELKESPAPKRAKKIEPAAVPAPVAKVEIPVAAPVAKAETPAPAPAVELAAPPTLMIEPTTVAGVPEPKPEPKQEPATNDSVLAELFPPSAEASEGPEPDEKPRRGPVWPV